MSGAPIHGMSIGELRALARVRPVATRELHHPNAYYGHATVLRRFAGLGGTRPLKVALEHGPYLDDAVWHLDAETPLPAYLCASRWRADLFTTTTGVRAEAIGPFIRYAAPDPPAFPADPVLLLFPAHSTALVDTSFDVAALLRVVDEVRGDYSAVVACVYWKDVLNGMADELIAAGVPCVTAGHHALQDFLPRLASIIGSASAVLTNELGSHVIYSVCLGRPVWLVPQEVVRRASGGAPLPAGHEHDWGHPRIARLHELFERRTERLELAQEAFVAEVAGVDALRSPGELRGLLTAAEQEWRAVPLRDRLRANGMRLARLGADLGRSALPGG